MSSQGCKLWTYWHGKCKSRAGSSGSQQVEGWLGRGRCARNGHLSLRVWELGLEGRQRHVLATVSRSGTDCGRDGGPMRLSWVKRFACDVERKGWTHL